MAERLKLCSEGTCLRIRMPGGSTITNTDGWSAVVGDLGKGQPRLEVWLDHFSGYEERKLYACLYSKERRKITSITKRVARNLWPVRVVTEDDTERGEFLVLAERLGRSEFNTPILENYSDGTFYGIYDATRPTAERVNAHFCERAAAFFEDVARALPGAKTRPDEERAIYPQVENRRRVNSHLQRERSKLLAAECKIRDGYRCRVCGLHFEEVYGELGHEFAEAHHMVPLGQLRDKVRTSLEDLVTVCANCHRMLHRMQGRRDDIKKLRANVRRHRS